jgi:hypothetical protein
MARQVLLAQQVRLATSIKQRQQLLLQLVAVELKQLLLALIFRIRRRRQLLLQTARQTTNAEL